MPFTDNETSDLRYYLGRSDYNRVEPCNEWEELNQALVLLSVDGEDFVREQLALLAGIDTKIAAALTCITVESADGARLRNPILVHNLLRAEGRRLAMNLARYLGISLRNTPWGIVGVHKHVTQRG